MIHRFFFKKEERLRSKILIQKLFDEGTIIRLAPFKILILKLDVIMNPPVQILISIPKRNFRKAVHRNLLKRRIREAYRLNKHLLYKELIAKETLLAIAFIYLAEEIPDFHLVEKRIKEALSEIGKFL